MSRQRKIHPRTVCLSKRRQRIVKRVTKRHLHAGSQLYKYRWRSVKRLEQAEKYREIDAFFKALWESKN